MQTVNSMTIHNLMWYIAAAIAAGHPGRNITHPGVPEIQPIIPTSTMTAIQYTNTKRFWDDWNIRTTRYDNQLKLWNLTVGYENSIKKQLLIWIYNSPYLHSKMPVNLHRYAYSV